LLPAPLTASGRDLSCGAVMTVTTSPGDAPIVALERTTSAIASARRATLAERYAANSLTAEWVSFAELAPLTTQWRELAGRALEPNVFYEPAFALEAAKVFGRDIGAVLVWSGTSPRELLGFFPAQIEPRRYGFKLPVMVGWTHPYAPLGTPLVEREAAEPVIAAWLAFLGENLDMPELLLWPFLPMDGPFAGPLNAILRRAQLRFADFNCHGRAQFAPRDDDRLSYLERALGRRKYKELRRQGRRLGEIGALLFTTKTLPAAVATGIEDFFAIEARGWKGKAGTASADRDDIRQFFKTAMVELAAERKVLVSRLYLDGRPIAAAITLRSADTAWFWKITYDEDFRRYSPGVMLTAAVTEELADDITIARVDSCATANHPMIDHIWRERLALGDRLVELRPGARFTRARRLELVRRAAIAAAKELRARLQRIAGPKRTLGV